MKITKVKRTKKRIIIDYIADKEERQLKSPDNPLPAFHAAFDALAPLVCEICHFHKGYARGLVVTEVKLTDKGNELVTFKAAKDVDDSTDTFRFSTPNRLTDLPKEEGVTSPPLKKEQVALITSLIDEAGAYINGDRAQGMIQFPNGEDDDEDDDAPAGEPENQLPFDPKDTGRPKKPKKPTGKDAAAGQ